ncbi:MAG: acyltransferase [Akkermansiaceae bacterium]|nr:acyltransferase [Akkermansiaceae bacterium]
MRAFAGRLKLFLFRLDSGITKLRCRLRGARFGRGCVVSGMPRLRMHRGSSVVLGDHVALLSRVRHNPLVRHRVSIQTQTPEAAVEIASHAGISGSRIICVSRVSIGEYTVIGPDCLIYDKKAHVYDPEVGWSARSLSGKPIVIGSRCYIGTSCIILKGVTIGDRCVVSAGTVVNRDVPAGHIAFGNPMRTAPLPERLVRQPSGSGRLRA